jgi:guanylate kinase
MTDLPATIERRGLLLVLSSPSGAGKTTLARQLLEAEGDALQLSVSVTTRPMRPGETDGEDYWFIDEARFGQMREGGELLEWAQVFGNSYGTPRQDVVDAVVAGRDVLFDVDWQGGRQLANNMPEDVVRVFILPPSAKVLEARLKSRNQDNADVIAVRMAQASNEISHWIEYEYVIVNADIDQSFDQLRAILAAERLKRERRTGMADLVEQLQRDLGESFRA